MSQPNQTQPSPDDLLADFTDRVLNGVLSEPVSSTDVELRGLEETVLHLKRTLFQETVEQRTLRRLQNDFNLRTQKAGSSTWTIWQLLRPRQRLLLAFAGAVLAVILIAFPFLNSTSGQVQGTAGLQPQAAIVVAGVVGVVALLLWVRRRK